jgi:hypothetical protein
MHQIMTKEIIMLDVAINTQDIETAIVDPDATQDQGGFKAIILDGQHRTEAMKKILIQNPNISFNIIYKVFLVKSNDEIIDRIGKLNRRREFDQDDIDKAETSKNFVKAIEIAIGKDNFTRQYIKKVHKIIQTSSTDKIFIAKHKSKTVEQFSQSLLQLAQTNYTAWNQKILTDSKFDRSARGQLIRTSKMYQFILEPDQWIPAMI